MKSFRFLGVAASLPLLAVAAPALAHNHSPSVNTAQTVKVDAAAKPITLAEVEAAQQAWGNALVSIAREYERGGQSAATRLAERVIDTAYGYDMGKVLFKPTLTVAPQTFRTDRAGALAYFVGGNNAFANDRGFALQGWRSFKIQNAGVLIHGNTATTMGNVMLTNAKGETVTVDKTWGFVRAPDGSLRIVLHHSSLPYQAS